MHAIRQRMLRCRMKNFPDVSYARKV